MYLPSLSLWWVDTLTERDVPAFTGRASGGVLPRCVPPEPLPVLLEGRLVCSRETGGVGLAGFAGSTGRAVTRLAR